MTAAVAGMTGKTGVPLFLAHKSQREGRDKNKRKIYIVCKFPGISGFFGRGASALCMLEREIVAAIMRYLKGVPGCFAWKTHGGMYGTAGIPDIIACVGGRFCAFEVKQPSGKLTRLQEVALKKIEDAGGVAGKVTSVEDVKRLLADMEPASAGEERRDL